MSNESKIKGNGNFVFQEIKNSKINLQNEDKKPQKKQTDTILSVTVVIIAIITLIVTAIIGWDKILNFFTK